MVVFFDVGIEDYLVMVVVVWLVLGLGMCI